MNNIVRLWVSPLRQERANEVSEHPFAKRTKALKLESHYKIEAKSSSIKSNCTLS